MSLNIGTELAYVYFKIDRLRHMEGFLSVTNVTGVLVVGGKRFEDELYHVVELLFTGISGWAGLATILICVGGGDQAATGEGTLTRRLFQRSSGCGLLEFG